MIIKITSPALAVWADGDSPIEDDDVLDLITPALPSKIEEAIGDDLNEDLAYVGIVGGEIWVERPQEWGLTAEARFWSPTALDEKTTAALVAEVMAQWSDGIGEGGFEFEADGRKVLVVPDDDPSEASVVESDVGTDVPPPSSVAMFARKGLVEEVRRALAEGDDPSGTLQGYSALHLAVLRGHTDIARVLLDAGSDVNQRCRVGETALELVALANKLDDDQSADLAERLLAKGATLGGSVGSNVLEYALNRRKVKLVNLLRSKGVES
jgi:hypothetical protein